MKGWLAMVNALVMHLGTLIMVWVELIINKRVYVYNKHCYLRFLGLICLYMLNNFILGKFFGIFPYAIIKWKRPRDYLVALGLFVFANALYFLIIQV